MDPTVNENAPLVPQNPSLLPSYSTARIATMAFQPVPRQKLIRARVLATLAFLFYITCAIYAVLVKDGWRTVSRENHYALSPNTWMALMFAGAQLVLQLYWIRNLFIYDERDIAPLEAVSYAQPYALSALFLGIYTLVFIHRHWLVAFIFILIVMITQLYAVSLLPLVTHDNLATQLNAKSFAALSVLLCTQATGILVHIRPPPNTFIQALAGVFFGIAGLVSDPIFGAGIVYDLIALVIGQHRLWAKELTWLTLAVGAVVLVKYAVFRIY